MIVLDWLLANWTFNTQTWWVWVLLALAAYRWAAFLVNEEGPWGVFDRLRRKRGIFQIQGGAPGIAPGYTAFTCVRCMSVWTAWWLLWLPWQFSLVFALSTGAILVFRVL
jgi:hypothetical protein